MAEPARWESSTHPLRNNHVHHKRKRSIQDTPADLTKMQLARQRLSVLQEELSGIEETEKEMEEIMKHVDALESILSSTKRLVS